MDNNTLSRDQFVGLINSMMDGVIITDHQDNVIMYNGGALSMLNRNTAIEGQSIDKFLVLSDKNKKQIKLASLYAKANNAKTNRDLRIYYKDGSYISVALNIHPIYTSYGSNKKGYIFLIRDISQERSLEEEREEFISVVSHELRTPIAIAEGNISNAQLMVHKNHDQHSVTDALEKAHDQIIFLSEMINDLSTLSRAERGKLSVDRDTINVKELIDELAKLYHEQAYEKGIKLQIRNDNHLEILHSSKLYVKEILQNFLTNAIKYTEKGAVTIGATSKSSGTQFYVEDTGIGISQSDKNKIFDKFFRSEDFRTKQYKGTGLGLYITKKLCDLLDAKLNVESELNKGSSFTVFIPNLQ